MSSNREVEQQDMYAIAKVWPLSSGWKLSNFPALGKYLLKTTSTYILFTWKHIRRQFVLFSYSYKLTAVTLLICGVDSLVARVSKDTCLWKFILRHPSIQAHETIAAATDSWRCFDGPSCKIHPLGTVSWLDLSCGNKRELNI